MNSQVQAQPVKRGLGNWKNLFKKPTLSELIVLFLLIMGIGLAYAYKHDTNLCRQTLENLPQVCSVMCTQLHNTTSSNLFGQTNNLSLPSLNP